MPNTSIFTASLAMIFLATTAYAQEKSTTTTTTTIEQTTLAKPPAPVKKASTPVKKPVVKAKAAPKPVEQTTTIQSTTTTTETVKPPPPVPMKEVVRKVYDEEQLEKMSDTLCERGFKAFVGSEKKNVCASKASSPDLAYSCVWDSEGPPAYQASTQGPCKLDYTEQKGSVIIKKETFPDDPPLSYGKEAHCCFRAAKGLEVAVPQPQ